MASISATAELRRWFELVDDVCKSHTQVLIRGQRGNAVLACSLVICKPRQPKPNAHRPVLEGLTIQHRLVHEVLDAEMIVKLLRLCSHDDE